MRAKSVWIATATLGAVVLVTSPVIASTSSPEGVWTIVPQEMVRESPAKSSRAGVRPDQFIPLQLDNASLARVLAAAPFEDAASKGDAAIIHLPTPSGDFEAFAVVEVPTMQPALAEWLAENGFPIATYRGRSLEDPSRTVALDFGGALGFHAQVIGGGERWQIDPQRSSPGHPPAASSAATVWPSPLRMSTPPFSAAQ